MSAPTIIRRTLLRMVMAQSGSDALDSRTDLIIFLSAGSTPQPAFPFAIPGVSSRHDQNHCEWNLVPFSVPL
jgi:hypothetical protein